MNLYKNQVFHSESELKIALNWIAYNSVLLHNSFLYYRITYPAAQLFLMEKPYFLDWATDQVNRHPSQAAAALELLGDNWVYLFGEVAKKNTFYGQFPADLEAWLNLFIRAECKYRDTGKVWFKPKLPPEYLQAKEEEFFNGTDLLALAELTGNWEMGIEAIFKKKHL